MLGKINVSVICGGKSSEHDISLLSATSIINNLNKEKYNIKICYISRKGIFYEYLDDVSNLNEEYIENNPKSIDRIIDLKTYFTSCDIAFPVLHGKYGEDGTIQGMLEILGVKYVGNDVLGSSIGMDKIMSKILVKNQGINIVNYIVVTESDLEEDIQERLKANNMDFPLFVKPNREGSSFGTNKVENMQELSVATKEALELDNSVLVEEYILGKKEVECAILGNEDIEAFTPGQICSATEIYDFDSKYVNTKSYTKIPADIPNEKLEQIKEYSKIIFKTLKLASLARVDFFVTDEKIYFNEVNTMPGFTNISMYPKMVEHDGINYSELLDRLIALGINR